MLAPRDRFRPIDYPSERLSACIGLVADTHMPERLSELPTTLFEALRGVDRIFHAGDLSECSVLDRLGCIAPVTLVQGNDEVGQARELPLHQLVTIAGRRILLTHGHYPNRAEEIASRNDDRWAPKLAYRAGLAQQVGASVVIFGHIHIPLAVEHDGVLLVNPGAIAAASGATRQRRQTVALLYIRDDGAVAPVHLDLADLTHPYVPRVDWSIGYQAAHDEYHASILTQELADDFAFLRTCTWWNHPEVGRPLWEVWYRAARRCWSGEIPLLTRTILLDTVRDDLQISAVARDRFEAALCGMRR